MTKMLMINRRLPKGLKIKTPNRYKFFNMGPGSGYYFMAYIETNLEVGKDEKGGKIIFDSGDLITKTGTIWIIIGDVVYDAYRMFRAFPGVKEDAAVAVYDVILDKVKFIPEGFDFTYFVKVGHIDL